MLENNGSPKANTDVSKLDLKYQFAFYDFCTQLEKCSREQAIEIAKQVYRLHLGTKQAFSDIVKKEIM